GANPLITPDGRYVVFVGASGIVPGITYTGNNVYVRDLQTNTTRIASVDPTGTHDVPVPGNTEYAISPDGRYIAFTANGNPPYAGLSNPNSRRAVFLRDLVAGTTVLVSHDTANDGQIRGDSIDLSMSTDGRYVLFRSNDSNLAANDTNGGWDVFRWD